MQKNLLAFLFAALIGIGSLSAATFNTVANGNWNSSSTWQNGQVPNPEDLNGNDVFLNHNCGDDHEVKLTYQPY